MIFYLILKYYSMKKLHLLPVMVLCLCMLLAKSGDAHTNDPFNLPTAIPVPSWVMLIDWDHPNVRTIDSLIRISAHSSTQVQASHTTPDGGEFDEDPYLTAYIRWRNKMTAFIQTDGTLRYDRTLARQLQFNPATTARMGNAGNQVSRSSGAAHWTLLGPVQTFSDNNNGLSTEQSNIYCIAVAPSNPSVLYASSEPGTLYRSSDKGQHWTSVTDTLYSCQASTIAI